MQHGACRYFVNMIRFSNCWSLIAANVAAVDEDAIHRYDIPLFEKYDISDEHIVNI